MGLEDMMGGMGGGVGGDGVQGGDMDMAALQQKMAGMGGGGGDGMGGGGGGYMANSVLTDSAGPSRSLTLDSSRRDRANAAPL